MIEPVELEVALRLAGERLLLSGHQQGPWGGGLGDIATALVVVCGLSREIAETVVEDYGLAQSLRGRGVPPMMRAHRRAARSMSRATVEAPTVVACDATVELPDGLARIGSVLFTDDACQLTATYDGPPSWTGHGMAHRRGANPPPHPPQLTVSDDQGTTALAHFNGGGSDERWRGSWVTQGPLSPSTAWLDLAGVRLPLGTTVPPAHVRVEPLPDELFVHRYLWHQLATRAHHFPDDDGLLDVLVHAGALAPDDPVIEQLAQVAHALQGGTVPSATKQALDEQWRNLLGRRPGNGPNGHLPVSALTPELDGTVVVVDQLHTEAGEFSIQVHVVGEGASMGHPFDESHFAVPLAWWAADDRGNGYLGHWGSRSGNAGDIAGDVTFPPLDPRATRLTLMPTSLRHRAVIDLPLPTWGST